MSSSHQKKTIWAHIHIDPLFCLIIAALLVYSALVMWSASGQDPGMMERKLAQICMGVIVMLVMAQIRPAFMKAGRPICTSCALCC